MLRCKTITIKIETEANITYSENIAHGLNINKIIAFFICSVVGSNSTSEISFCNMVNRETVRIVSARNQDVTVTMAYIYSI